MALKTGIFLLIGWSITLEFEECVTTASNYKIDHQFFIALGLRDIGALHPSKETDYESFREKTNTNNDVIIFRKLTDTSNSKTTSKSLDDVKNYLDHLNNVFPPKKGQYTTHCYYKGDIFFFVLVTQKETSLVTTDKLKKLTFLERIDFYIACTNSLIEISKKRLKFEFFNLWHFLLLGGSWSTPYLASSRLLQLDKSLEEITTAHVFYIAKSIREFEKKNQDNLNALERSVKYKIDNLPSQFESFYDLKTTLISIKNSISPKI